jgi:hypothetical protein
MENIFGFRIVLFALILLSPVLNSCTPDENDIDSEPPPAPGISAKECIERGQVFPELGIDAMPGNGGIFLSWYMDSDPEDLFGFEVFRSMYPDSEFVKLDVDPEQLLDYYSFTDTSSEIIPQSWSSDRHWYYVRALDEDGNYSAPSDTVSYKLWSYPRIYSGDVVVQNDSLFINWRFEYTDYDPLGFLGFNVLICDEGLNNLICLKEIRTDVDNLSRSWNLVDDIGLEHGNWRLRIDVIISSQTEDDVISNPDDCPLAGAESNWISFSY